MEDESPGIPLVAPLGPALVSAWPMLGVPEAVTVGGVCNSGDIMSRAAVNSVPGDPRPALRTIFSHTQARCKAPNLGRTSCDDEPVSDCNREVVARPCEYPAVA